MRALPKFSVLLGTVCTTAGLALAAAEPPKEGNYDFISCQSGVANPIVFSKTNSAATYEYSGATLSNPPGDMFDRASFRCVGLGTSFDGKTTVTAICEAIYPDGDKVLLRTSVGADGTGSREAIAGTGKYEGLVSTGTVTPVGTFPVIKAGTFQSCSHQTGTYKLK